MRSVNEDAIETAKVETITSAENSFQPAENIVNDHDAQVAQQEEQNLDKDEEEYDDADFESSSTPAKIAPTVALAAAPDIIDDITHMPLNFLMLSNNNNEYFSIFY